jgi:hypothetical protein
VNKIEKDWSPSSVKLRSAKIVDLSVSFDASPVPLSSGEVLWASVTITYAVSGLLPSVRIRLPVSWNESDTIEERKFLALRGARQLIDHACMASGLEHDAPASSPVDAIITGLAQELGLSEPTTKPPPKQIRRR